MNCTHQMLSLTLSSGMVVSLLEAAVALRRRKMALCDTIRFDYITTDIIG